VRERTEHIDRLVKSFNKTARPFTGRHPGQYPGDARITYQNEYLEQHVGSPDSVRFLL
jgi:hypothetical protein